MTDCYFPIIYFVPLISFDGQASQRLFIAPEICHFLYRQIKSNEDATTQIQYGTIDTIDRFC